MNMLKALCACLRLCMLVD